MSAGVLNGPNVMLKISPATRLSSSASASLADRISHISLMMLVGGWRAAHPWNILTIASSVERLLHTLGIVAVVGVGVELLIGQRLEHRAGARQRRPRDLRILAPEPRADERLLALEVDPLNIDHDNAFRNRILNLERGAERGI